jgi:hypothetical protein
VNARWGNLTDLSAKLMRYFLLRGFSNFETSRNMMRYHSDEQRSNTHKLKYEFEGEPGHKLDQTSIPSKAKECSCMFGLTGG